MSTGKNILKNTFFLSAQQLFMQVVGVFVVGYVASVVGVEDYGMFIFSLSFVSIFGVLANLGTRSYATREIAANRENASHIFSEVFPLRILLSLCAGIVALIVIHVLPYSEKEVLLVEIAIFSQLCTWVYLNTFMVYEAFEMMAYPVTVDLFVRVFVLVAAFFAIRHGYGIVSIAFCYAVGNFIEIFIAFYFFRLNLFRPKFKFYPLMFHKNISILKLSFPFCVLNVSNVMMSESNKVMISLIDGTASVGLYGVAFTLSSRLAGIADALATAFFPVIMRLKKELSDVGFKDKMTESLQGIIVLIIPLTIGVFIVSNEIVNIVYRSSDFAPAASTLKIHILSLPFGALSFVFGFSLISEGKQKILVKLTLIILIINLILNYYLISIYSYNGAAIATTISVFLKFIGLLLLAGNIIIWKKFIRTAILSLIIGSLMGCFVLWLKSITLVGAIVFGIIFYTVMIILTKALDVARLLAIIKSR